MSNATNSDLSEQLSQLKIHTAGSTADTPQSNQPEQQIQLETPNAETTSHATQSMQPEPQIQSDTATAETPPDAPKPKNMIATAVDKVYEAQVNPDDIPDPSWGSCVKRTWGKWLKSKNRARLFQILRVWRPAGGWKITKAICVALGGLVTCQVSIEQLLLFVDIVRHLRTTGECRDIKMYAQDPMFSNKSKHVLRAFDIEVLVVPEGERMVRRGVFLMVPQYTLEYQFLARRPALQPSLHLGLPFGQTRCSGYHHGCAVINNLTKANDVLSEKETAIVDQARKQIEYLDSFPKGYHAFRARKYSEDGLMSDGLRKDWCIYIEKDGTVGANREPEPEEVADHEVRNLTERETCPCCMLPESGAERLYQ